MGGVRCLEKRWVVLASFLPRPRFFRRSKLSFLPERAFHGIVLSQAPALRPACMSSAHFLAHTSHILTAFRRAEDGPELIGVRGQGAARRRRAWRGRSGRRGGRGQLRSKIREPPARTAPRLAQRQQPHHRRLKPQHKDCAQSLPTPANGELFSLASLGISFVYQKTGMNRVSNFYETTLRSGPVQRPPFYCTCSRCDVM